MQLALELFILKTCILSNVFVGVASSSMWNRLCQDADDPVVSERGAGPEPPPAESGDHQSEIGEQEVGTPDFNLSEGESASLQEIFHGLRSRLGLHPS